MGRSEKKDTPDWLMGLGERTPWQDKFIISGLVRVVAGSSSEAYIQARWHAVEELINFKEEVADLPIAEPDREAGLATILLPRLKRKSVVITADANQFERIRDEWSGTRREPAVVYSYKNGIHAGVIPDMGLLGVAEGGYTAAMRVGRSQFGVGLGVWIPKEMAIVVPDNMGITEQNVPIDKLPYYYPGTPLL